MSADADRSSSRTGAGAPPPSQSTTNYLDLVESRR